MAVPRPGPQGQEVWHEDNGERSRGRAHHDCRHHDGDGTGGTISAAEKAQVVSGALYEAVREEKGQGAATLAAQFAQRSAEILAGLQARYAQYGRNI